MAYISEEDKKALSALRAKGAKKGSIFKNVGLVIGLFGVLALIAVFVLFALDYIADGLLVALFMILAAVFVVALVLYGYGKSFRSTYQRKAFAFLTTCKYPQFSINGNKFCCIFAPVNRIIVAK